MAEARGYLPAKDGPGKPPRLSTRMLVGSIAGFAATMAMTAVMHRMHRRLPARERYPLTPRELIDSASAGISAAPSNALAKDLTLAGHFGYGAAVGGLLTAASPRLTATAGAAAGAVVWWASYMGWIPALPLLKPATRHPPRRNLLMIVAHLVWGAVTAISVRELLGARETIFERGADRDVHSPERSM